MTIFECLTFAFSTIIRKKCIFNNNVKCSITNVSLVLCTVFN
ncbi:hypothetical protein ACJIZ3_005093 [Penstemon smallii]|uniref:Uncharacterized protein n=1 Tax=Penstemon smallii TaxID=265156 RepID=A0ABD3S3X2_9LAMI